MLQHPFWPGLNTGFCALPATAAKQCAYLTLLACTAGVFAQDRPPSLPELRTLDQPDLVQEYLERQQSLPQPNQTILPEQVRNSDLRLQVSQFKFIPTDPLQDLSDYLPQLEQMAEQLRRQFMRYDDEFAQGYTRAELEELADYLHNLEQGSSGALHETDLNNLVELMRKQQAQRGLLQADLDDIVQQLTLFLQQQGFFLAQVQLPAQEVEQGVVWLVVQPGILGQVDVQGQQRYSKERLIQPFTDQLGQVVVHAPIEEGLFLLNDLPGLTLAGEFSAGDNHGETRLHLNVLTEKRWSAQIRANNFGSKYTGPYRLHTLINGLNPLGIGDQITLGYLKSFDPANIDLGHLAYDFPLWGSRTRATLAAIYNEYRLTSTDQNDTFSRLNTHGMNRTFSAQMRYRWVRSRAFNLSLSSQLSDSKTITHSNAQRTTFDHSRKLDLAVELDRLGNLGINILTLGKLGVQYGQFVEDNSLSRQRNPSDHFWILYAQTDTLMYLPLSLSIDDSRLLINSHLQYSDNALPSYEQLELSGASGVRAYAPGKFSADSGALVHLEWLHDLPRLLNIGLTDSYRLNDVLDIGLIFDTAYGNNRTSNLSATQTGTSKNWAYLSSAGLTAKLNWGSAFAAQLSLSKPLQHRSSVETLFDDTPSSQLYVDLSYTY